MSLMRILIHISILWLRDTLIEYKVSKEGRVKPEGSG